MRTDVADFLASGSTLLQCLFHGAHSPLAVWVCSRHVMGIARQTVTTDFRVDACPTFQCGAQRFEHKHTCAFARNHSLPAAIKWLANFRRDCSQLSEPRVGDTR